MPAMGTLAHTLTNGSNIVSDELRRNVTLVRINKKKKNKKKNSKKKKKLIIIIIIIMGHFYLTLFFIRNKLIVLYTLTHHLMSDTNFIMDKCFRKVFHF